jgi:succinylornithine aminotransferase
MSLQVSRHDFDQWMMPVYAPAAFVPVRAEGETCSDITRSPASPTG